MATQYRQFISGHYTATWNGATIGTTKNGFAIRQVPHEQAITVDEGGDVPVDGINRGTEVFVDLDWVEYGKIKAAILAVTGGVIGAALTNVGVLQTTLAKALVLTPDNTALRTYTAVSALCKTDIEALLANQLRAGHCSFYCYPDPSQSVNSSAAAITESGGSIG